MSEDIKKEIISLVNNFNSMQHKFTKFGKDNLLIIKFGKRHHVLKLNIERSSKGYTAKIDDYPFVITTRVYSKLLVEIVKEVKHFEFNTGVKYIEVLMQLEKL